MRGANIAVCSIFRRWLHVKGFCTLSNIESAGPAVGDTRNHRRRGMILRCNIAGMVVKFWDPCRRRLRPTCGAVIPPTCRRTPATSTTRFPRLNREALALTPIATSLVVALTHPAQAASQCDGNFYHASGEGSFEPAQVSGGLSDWPAVRGAGNYRLNSLSLVCLKDRYIHASPAHNLSIRIGNLKFQVGMHALATSFSTASRSGDQSVITGVGLVDGVDGRWPFQLTIRDKDQRLSAQGGEPGDYIKIKIFDPRNGAPS